MVLGFGEASAQSTSYVYDANGHVVAVTASNGTSVQYGYNTLGHTSQISAPLSPGQLAIFAFMPTHGEAGTQVAIQGQGFDSNAANDTVSFNGTVATILSASSTQLVTAVPSGATTGPISVTVGSQTAASATSFIVDDTGVPPTITQVSPQIASVGSTITVTGAHLDPVAGYTRVQMGGRDIPTLAALSDTQLQYVVPSDGATGYVAVETPYGLATSTLPVVVLPSGVSASSVVSSGNATVNGGGVNLSIGASGQTGVVTFTAPQSGWVSLQASAISTSASSINYTVYAPGNGVIQQGTISSTSPSIHLPHLAAGANYLVLIQPSGAGAQMTLGVETNALLAINTQATVVTAVSGQSKRVLFNASAGQNIAFQINGASTSPSGQGVAYTVYAPNGATYASTTTSGNGVINLGYLTASGAYQVVIAPGSGVTGTMQIEAAQGITGALNGTAQSYTAAVPGQNVYLTFSASQGENLELTLNGVNVPGASNNQVIVYVNNAAGNQVASFYCYASNPGGSCTQHLWNLLAGAYSVIVVPAWGGTPTFNAVLQDDIVGPTIATNGSANIALGAGQVERYTFNANAGDTIALNVLGVTTTPGGQGVGFLVYRPDAGVITTGTGTFTSFGPNGSQTVNLSNLPVSGTYTVIVAPNYGLAATAKLSVVGGVTGTLSATGTSQSYAANVTGQAVYLSFNATQGENLELTFNGVNVPGGDYNQFIVYVNNAAGSQVASFYCHASDPGSSCTQHLWNLAAGTYSVTVSPAWGGTPSFNVLLQDDIVGPTIAMNGSANIALGAGQVERYTFNANAGDTLALNVSGVTTTPSGQSVTFLVYRPDAGVITTGTGTFTSFGPSGSQTVNLSNLPVSGTYTVIVAPNSGLAATAKLSVVAGVTGTLSATGASQSYTANVTGENVYLSFTATQGENLELTFNGVNVTGGDYNQFIVYVNNATGSQLASFYCHASDPGSSCIQHLWNLAAGTYYVTVSPAWGGKPTFNVLLQDDIVGPAIAMNGSANIALGAGQVERYTFNANAGDTLALNVSGVTTTPSGQGVTFLVYRPDAGVITTGTGTFTSFGPSGSQTVNLSNLPVSGTYTVIVAPNSGLAATAKLSVVAGVTGTLSATGASQSYTANVTGENVYLSFTATQGENLELTFNGVNVTGGDYNQFIVYVNNATGSQLASFYCHASDPGSSCIQHLWNLAAGTYYVMVSPAWGGTPSFNVLLQDDIVGQTLTAGNQTSMYLAAGQVERLSFVANPRDTVQLQVAWLAQSATNTGVTFLVYRPDAGTITSGTPAYTSFHSTGAQTVNLSNLPVGGTYTVIVAPDYGLPVSVQLADLDQYAGDPPVYGTPTLTTNGTPQNEASSGAGQSVTMSFNANLGDNLELTLSNLSVTNTYYFHVDVYDPNGNDISSNNCYVGNTTCRYALWNLSAGTYSVVLGPAQSNSSVSVSAQVGPDVIGPAISANTPTTVNLVQGEVERLTFNANLGDTDALQISGVSGQQMCVNVYRPDIGAITPTNYYTSFCTGGTQIINLPSLPASGTYTLAVYSPNGGVSSGQVTLVPGSTGTLASSGTTQNFSPTLSNQNIYLSFNANLGDNLELTLSNLNATNNYYFYVNVYDSHGNNISSNPCYVGNGTCRYALWNLAGGAYSVILNPTQSNSAISVSAQIGQDVTGPAISANTPTTVNLVQGEVERLTFNANLGDTDALQISGVSGQQMCVNVYRPDIGAITPTNYYTSFCTGGTQIINLPSLPASGTYTLAVYSPNGGVSSGQVTLVPGSTGTLASSGTTQNFAPTLSNQNIYLSFNANLGDNLELTLSNLIATNNYYFYVNVYDSHGNNISSNPCYVGNGTCRYALWNLAAGAYSVILSPAQSNSSISVSAQLGPDVLGLAISANTPATVNLAQGEVERMTFNGNLGDAVALQISGVSGQQMCINVYRPDIGAITPTNYYTSFCTGGTQIINLPNLPASGTYTLAVYSPNGGVSSGQITLVPGSTGTLASNGTTQNFAPTLSNQNIYLSFNANLGDNLELTLSNLTATNTYYFHVDVYDSHGNNISSNPCYVGNGTCRYALWNLAAGAYSVILSPAQSNSSISVNAQVGPDVIGPAISANTPATVNLTQGEVERLTFNGNLGDTVALQISGVSGQQMCVNVYRPDTGAITTTNYYTSFCASGTQTTNLPNLPASGTYTLAMYSPNGGASSGQVALASSTTGTISITGSLGNFAAAAVGQNVSLTFNVPASGNFELTLSNVNAASASTNGFEVRVAGPSGLQIANFYCYASSPGSSCTQPIWNLSAGTYSIVAVPVFGGTLSFSAQLQPDITGASVTAGNAANIALQAGQAERVTFSANQGTNVVLQLAGVSTTPANQPLYVDVYRPDVGEIETSNVYASFEATGANSISLSSLPVGGAYTAVLHTGTGIPATAQFSYATQ